VVAAAEARRVIASVRGLIVLAAIAVLCAVLALCGGAPGVVDHALVPGLDPDRVVSLAWTGAPRTPLGRDVAIARARVEDPSGSASGQERPGAEDASGSASGPGRARVEDPSGSASGPERWQWPDGAPVEPAAVDRLLTALRGARWHRASEEDRAGRIRATLTVTTAAGSYAIGLGEPLGDQAWIVIDHRALLVDGWVAHALDAAPLELRVRRPLADLGGWVGLRGAATCAVDVAAATVACGAAPVRLDPTVMATLARTLGDLAIVRLPDSPIARGSGLEIVVRVHAAEAWQGVAAAQQVAPGENEPRIVVLAGPCPGAPELRAILATTGDGCVAAETAGAIEALAGQLAGPPEAIADRRLAPSAVRVTLLDGGVVDTTKRTVNGAGAEPARITELVDALAASATIAAIPTTPPRGQLVVVDRRGVATKLEVRGDVVVEPGQPFGRRPGAAQLAIVTEPSGALAVPVLWVEEPIRVASITVDGVTFTRGAVIGEWSGTTTPRRLDALADALAAPRAELGAPVALDHPHHISFVVAPPVGAAVRRELDVAPDGARCAARIDGQPRYVTRALCDALASRL
jgi:hypothetical protein